MALKKALRAMCRFGMKNVPKLVAVENAQFHFYGDLVLKLSANRWHRRKALCYYMRGFGVERLT